MTRKTFVTTVVVQLGLWALSSVCAQETGRGAGIFLGSAVGIGAKAWVDDRFAATAGLGWSAEGDDSLKLHAAYLIHSAEAPQRLALFRHLGTDGRFLFYYGGGVGLSLLGRNRLGFRAPVGLAYAAAPAASWGVYLEVVPVLDIVPGADWDTTAFAGWRRYFDLPLPALPIADESGI